MGEELLNFWRWLQNATQQAAIAENPAVMTAAGWRINRNGQVKQDQQNNKNVKQLRNNLTAIGDAAISAPTMTGDIDALATAVRHPVQTIKAVKKGISNKTDYVRNINKTRKELDKGITKANASKITPEQWTAAQDAAIARGDMAEAQRLRDLHFEVNAPTPYISKGVYQSSGNQSTISQADYYNGNDDLITLYHSSVDADNLIKKGFDGVEHGLGRTKGEPEGTIFASANQDYAADYSNLYVQKGLSTPDKVGLMELKVPRGAGVFEGNEVRLRPEHIKEIAKSTYKKTPWLRWLKTRKTDNNLFNTKSADAVTYDDNGVRIPLGERDNFKLNDIRYGLLPFAAGGVGYGLYNTYNR